MIKKKFIFTGFIYCLSALFLFQCIYRPTPAYAHELNLPAPGEMISLSPAYVPVLIKGLKVHPDNPLLFDFILDTGKSGLDVNSQVFKNESQKLIKYFLAALTIKEDDLWVNLSPYEKDRIIPKELGLTELGRDMLAQDYLLKQLTASLIYPEKELGKQFWNKIYARLSEKCQGEVNCLSTNIPVNTFNKVWITADKAKVLERNNAGYVIGAHLKVMLEEDYLAQNSDRRHFPNKVMDRKTVSVSNLIRDIVIPELEREVNEGKHFAPLRQMYYAMILSSWYKLSLKQALLNQVYSNKNKTSGVLSDDNAIKEKIYDQYLKAYKKGVFNYIKEDVDAFSQKSIPRKYFSGGEEIFRIPPERLINRAQTTTPLEAKQMVIGDLAMVSTKFNSSGSSKADKPSILEYNFDFNYLPKNKRAGLEKEVLAIKMQPALEENERKFDAVLVKLKELKGRFRNVRPDDFLYLTFIMQDLITNAIDAEIEKLDGLIDSNKRVGRKKVFSVSIRLVIDQDKLILSISDSGKGVDKVVMTRWQQNKFITTKSGKNLLGGQGKGIEITLKLAKYLRIPIQIRSGRNIFFQNGRGKRSLETNRDNNLKGVEARISIPLKDYAMNSNQSELTLASRLRQNDRDAINTVLSKVIHIKPERMVTKAWGGDQVFLSANSEEEKASNRISLVTLSDGSSIPLAELLNITGNKIFNQDLLKRYKGNIPLYPKLLLVKELLSVQGHPRGSSEVYYIRRAPKGAKIYLGFKNTVKNPAALKALLSNELQKQQEFIQLLDPQADQTKVNQILQEYFSKMEMNVDLIYPQLRGYFKQSTDSEKVKRLLIGMREAYWQVLDLMNAIDVKPGMIIHNTVPLRYVTESMAEVHALGNPAGVEIETFEVRNVGPTFRAWDNNRFPVRPIDIDTTVSELSLRGTGLDDFIVHPHQIKSGIERVVTTPEFIVDRISPSPEGLTLTLENQDSHILIPTKGDVIIEARDGTILGRISEGASGIVPYIHEEYKIKSQGDAELLKIVIPTRVHTRLDIARSPFIPESSRKNDIRDIPMLEIKGRTFFVRFLFEDSGFDPQNASIETLNASIDTQTINYLLRNGGKVVLYTHNKRPGGKFNESLTMIKAYQVLEKLLGRGKVIRDNGFFDESGQFKLIGPTTETLFRSLTNGQALLLENTRFDSREESENEAERISLARDIASLDQTGKAVFVNDEFGISHREQAATVNEMSLLMNGVRGLVFNVEEERHRPFLRLLQDKNKRGAVVAIFGGAKQDKGKEIVDFVNRQLQYGDYLIIGGKFAYELLRDSQLRDFRERGINVYLTEDWSDESRKDIGPKTIEQVKNYLGKAKLVFWEGPVGQFEDKNYEHGGEEFLKEILRLLEQKQLTHAFITGGDLGIHWQTLLNKTERELNLIPGLTASHGGGTSIAYFAQDGQLPGVRFLKGFTKKVVGNFDNLEGFIPEEIGQSSIEIDKVKEYFLDLDGVVLNTLPINREAFITVYLMMKKGIRDLESLTITEVERAEAERFFKDHIGESMTGNLRILFNKWIADGTLHGIENKAEAQLFYKSLHSQLRVDEFRRIIALGKDEAKKALLMPGVLDFLRSKVKEGKPVNIVSVSKKEERMFILEALGLIPLLNQINFVSGINEKINAVLDVMEAKGYSDSDVLFVDDAPLVVEQMRERIRLRQEKGMNGYKIIGMPNDNADAKRMNAKADWLVKDLSGLLPRFSRLLLDKSGKENQAPNNLNQSPAMSSNNSEDLANGAMSVEMLKTSSGKSLKEIHDKLNFQMPKQKPFNSLQAWIDYVLPDFAYWKLLKEKSLDDLNFEIQVQWGGYIKNKNPQQSSVQAFVDYLGDHFEDFFRNKFQYVNPVAPFFGTPKVGDYKRERAVLREVLIRSGFKDNIRKSEQIKQIKPGMRVVTYQGVMGEIVDVKMETVWSTKGPKEELQLDIRRWDSKEIIKDYPANQCLFITGPKVISPWRIKPSRPIKEKYYKESEWIQDKVNANVYKVILDHDQNGFSIGLISYPSDLYQNWKKYGFESIGLITQSKGSLLTWQDFGVEVTKQINRFKYLVRRLQRTIPRLESEKMIIKQFNETLSVYDSAMQANKRDDQIISTNVTTWRRGGIDLNVKNLRLAISKQDQAVVMKLDRAILAQFEQGNFTGIIPEIIRIIPISNISTVFNVN